MQLAKIYLTNKSVFYPGMCPKKERHLSIKCCVESIKPMNINEIGCRTEIREKMKEKIAKDNPSELFFYPIYMLSTCGLVWPIIEYSVFKIQV